MAHITAPTTEAWISYTATAAQTAFTIPWSFRATDDIRVWVNDVEVTTGFTVSGTAADGGYTGGTLTFTVGRTLDDIVRLSRDTPKQRTTDFPYPSSTLNIETLNSALDEAHMIIQELERDRKRGLRAPDGEPVLNELPDAATRAETVLIFDEDGQPSVTAISAFTGGGGGGGEGGVTLPISMSDVTGLTAALAAKAAGTHTHVVADVSDSTATGQALVTAASAAAARTVLGLGTAALDDAGDYAAASHTHAPGDITQAGATSGQVLSWSGAAWAPATITSGMAKISSTSFTATANIDIALPAGYDYYLLLITGVRVGTGAAPIEARLSQDSGSSYLSGASEYAGYINGVAGNDAVFRMAGVNGLATGQDAFGSLVIWPGAAGRNAFMKSEMLIYDFTSTMAYSLNACRLATTTARATHVRLRANGANFAAQGAAILYGAVT